MNAIWSLYIERDYDLKLNTPYLKAPAILLMPPVFGTESGVFMTLLAGFWAEGIVCMWIIRKVFDFCIIF